MRQKFTNSPNHWLLDDIKVERWLENAERGSPIVAHDYLRQMGRVCRDFSTTPQKLAKMNERHGAEFLSDLVSRYEELGLKSSTITNYMKAVKSWWSFSSGMVVNRRIKLRRDDNTYQNETIPTRSELHRILEHADLRAKVGVSLMAFCGFRPEVLGSYLGDDGLKMGDLPEMSIKGGSIEFALMPTMVRVRKTISKTGNPYFVFIPEQGCGYLKEYLEFRIRGGESIAPDTAVITATKDLGRPGTHIRTPNVGDLLRKAIRSAGFNWRPLVLRRHFDLRSMDAEAEGLIINSWRVFFMGHKGDMEATYTVNKALPEETVEKMREAYARVAEKYLATATRETTSKDEIAIEVRRQGLVFAGFTDEEIDKLGDLSKLTTEEIQEIVRRRQMENLGLGKGNGQKVVAMHDVEGWIERGFEFVSPLPEDKAVVRLPR